MRVKMWIDTGFAGAKHETEEEEVPDDISDEELDEWARDYCFERIEYGWKKLEDKKGSK